MEFSISKKKFLWMLNTVQKGVAKNTTLPILENVLLCAERDGMEVTTTDLETVVRVSSKGVEVVKEGNLTLPCRSLSEIVKGLKGAEVRVIKSNGKDSATIIDGGDNYYLSGLNPDEYPDLSRYEEGEKAVEFGAGLLEDMIRKTLFAVSTDRERYNLRGVFFEGLGGGVLRAVATDGYRLCRLDRKVGGDPGFLKDGVILPAEGLRKLGGVIKGYNGDVKMWLDDKSMVFKGEDSDALFGGDSFIVVMKLVDSNFPEYNQVIPEVEGEKITVDRRGMLECLRKVAVVSRWVDFKLIPGKINMFCKGEDREDSVGVGMDVDYGGKEKGDGFQVRYWTEFLSKINESSIEIEVFDQSRVWMVRPKEDRDYLGIIMPIGKEDKND